MEDYKPNSYRSRAEAANKSEEKRVEKVVKGKAKTKKKSEIKKFTDVFISEDISNVKTYIVMDVLIPAVKKAISDIVRDGVDMLLYGESGKSKKRSDTSYVSYRDYSKRDSYGSARMGSEARFDYDDIIFDSRGEAEAVREQMVDVIDRYGFVTVADMYDMADLTAPYTGNSYGWKRISTAEVVRVRDGYILKLPKAIPID